ncbi:MAG: hypothetical protein U0M61_10375 [Succinivibrio sp.]|nr:hypothetical protein [Succinivibrio sp.]
MTKKELNKDNIQKLKKQFANEKANIQKIFCENCGENLVFTFKEKDSLIHIPLSQILECLLIAETEGEVPHIDESWWDSLESIYPNIENLRIELKSD